MISYDIILYYITPNWSLPFIGGGYPPFPLEDGGTPSFPLEGAGGITFSLKGGDGYVLFPS